MPILSWISLLASTFVLTSCQSVGLQTEKLLAEDPNSNRIRIESVQASPSEAQAILETPLQAVRFQPDILQESLEGTAIRAQIEPATHAQGTSSVRLSAEQPGQHLVSVARLENLDWQNLHALVYRAKLRTQNLHGQAALGMSVYIQGEMPAESAQNVETSLTRDTFPDWTPAESLYLLKPGQRIGQLELFLVLNGTGTVWVQDAQLLERKPANPNPSPPAQGRATP